jgi:ADP-ribosylglycohydrolase
LAEVHIAISQAYPAPQRPDLFGGPIPHQPQLDAIVPKREESPMAPLEPDILRDRVRGCLLGGAIGDALGAPIEFETLAMIRRDHGPAGLTDYAADWRGKTGLITDDTQMTLFTAEGLIRGGDTMAVRDAYLRWLDTQRNPAPPPADTRWRTGRLREQTWLYSQRAPGNACLSGLRADFPGPARPGEPGPINPGSKGCGTVMRSAPFGLAAPDARSAFRLAADCAQITHGHPTGYYAAGAFAAIIHLLAHQTPLTDAITQALALLAEHPGHEETTTAIEAALTLAATGDPTPEKLETLGAAWIAEEALAIPLYCALTTTDFETGVLLAVNHSGDSDSTGAIYGNLLGATHGQHVLPPHWLTPLEGRPTITDLADALATHITASN